MTELEGGYLKGHLRPEDYDIKQWVSFILSEQFPNGIAPKDPFQEGSPTQLPRESSQLQMLMFLLLCLSVQGIDGSPPSWPTGGPRCAFARFIRINGRS